MDDVAFLLEQAFGKIAAQRLVRVDLDHVSIPQISLVAHGGVADHDGLVGFEHLEAAEKAVEIAENAEENIASGPGSEQDVILVEQGRVVRHKIGRLRVLKVEAPAVGVGMATQVVERQLGVVVEENFSFQRGLDTRVGAQADAIKRRRHVFQRDDQHAESEPHLKRAIAGPAFFQLDFVVFGHGDENVGERNVFLGVEIEDEVLMGQHLLVDHDALAGIDPAEFPRAQGAALDGNGMVAEIFDQDEIAVAVDGEAVCPGQLLHSHVRGGI